MRSIRNIYFSSFGLLAGLSSWVFVQSGFHIIDVFSHKYNQIENNFLFENYFFEGSLVGLGLGLVLYVRASVWYHHSMVIVLSKMFNGALFGVVIGVFSFYFGYFMQTLKIDPWVCRISSWTLLGLLFVVATEIFRLHSGCFISRVISGGIGGLVGGSVFEILLLYQISGPNHLFGLIIIGFSISFVIGINENRFTSCALLILSGPQEGQKILIDQNNYYLGYGANNDFILNGYAEVHNRHAFIIKNNKEVFINNIYPENEVLVNYRTIDHQHSIKKGDIIKIGTALMQYYEI